MEEEYQSFVCIAAKDGSDDIMELPRETNDTVLLSTIQAQFPSAIGLKYKSSSGGWRGIRAENNVLDPPYGGWGDAVYIITESDALKRKSVDQSDRHERKSRKASKLLEDMIVLGLPFSTTEEELHEYFNDKCGDLAFAELKLDRNSQKSRGFGFIRFNTEEAAKEALRGRHEIDGRKLEVRLSRKGNEVPIKLFVGRLATGTTQDEVSDYFSEFGDLNDVFVPSKPFRGFGFITFCDQDDGMKVLRISHSLKGARLHVTHAEPKQDQGPGRMENFGVNLYGNQSTDLNPSFGQKGGYGDSRNFQQQNFQQQQEQTSIGQKDVASELKDMLLTLINSRK